MELEIYLHNNLVEQELQKSNNGNIVSLTDLLIKKEKIISSIYKNKNYGQHLICYNSSKWKNS